ncbi:MAG: nicotinamide-nucleotide adenylyltransferase [Candidatus Aenigmarchaeota archaeon]|nr:nicotinamide-nucleotide adenylyltransferase [Candidatus Aenigmarchaeota archaeon]
MRGLLVGRFQPPHYGHLSVVKYALEQVDELIIVIGSPQLSHFVENPFTAGERHFMLKKALDEAEIQAEHYYIVHAPDINHNAIWVAFVVSLSPPFHIVYSNNPLVCRLFSEVGVKVEEPPLFNREKFSATEIRKRMRTGEDWQSLVPRAVVTCIEEIGGIERLSAVAQTED